MRVLSHIAPLCLLFVATAACAADADFSAAATPLLARYCGDCHSADGAEANLNLLALGAAPKFGTQYGAWKKVIERLEEKTMPPADAAQPTERERRQLIETITSHLNAYIEQHAGDPGKVVMRRLTSAEYAYTIEDLTGLKFDFSPDLVSDAVGGAGFTNVGDVQFVEETALERYLEAAKKVAAHAVVGAGPLDFYIAAGETGRELSAIHRIQDLYRRHGFRTAAGEGGEPFGLDWYPRAFYAAWRFHHRQAHGQAEATLAEIAASEGIEPRFALHVYSVVSAADSSYPTAEICKQWRALPPPDAANNADVRRACDELYQQLYRWQHMLASATADEEEAAVLAPGPVELASEHSFEAALDWPDDATSATIELSVLPVDQTNAKPLVVWRNARMRFRRDRRWTPREPLRELLTDESAGRAQFGRHPAEAEIDNNDFVLGETEKLVLEFPVPAGATSAQFFVDVGLDLVHGDEFVVRCAITDGVNPGETAASTGEYSTLLADPNGANYQEWKPGIEQFAALLPEVSHGEPAPSDRDTIPAPFDNTYNTAERNHFHARLKYHRDDAFLVQHLLNDDARRRLDEAWADLLTSFDYHDDFYHFTAQKFGLPTDKKVAELDKAWIAGLPAEPREVVERLHRDYLRLNQALAAAEPRHVEQAIDFAERAWRRPLSKEESDRLRDFYAGLRADQQLAHADAVRMLLARILVAPAFLYRAETPPQSADAQVLSDWELANRLSFFLWSSIPDEELRRAAAAGELQDEEQLARQTRRMLHDAKACRLATEFFGQWLGFYRFDEHRGVDSGRFPEFTDAVKQAMHDEAAAFFTHIVRENRPVGEILKADYTFLNAPLAAHYGLPANDIPANEFVRVDNVDRYQRGGLLRMGAVLTYTSAPLRTSPVKRGDWILRRVLGTPVPPPPADAGSIPADDVQADGKTLRERLEAHRSDASCVNCHSRIDPLGFALEQYDAVGRWRDTYRDGQSIDTSGVLKSGEKIDGPAALMEYLESQQQQFHQTLSTRLLAYALGRTELASDRPLVREMVETLNAGGGVADLAVQIATSRQFRYRQAEAAVEVSAAGEQQ